MAMSGERLPHGYMGNVLYVDLTRSVTRTEPLDSKRAGLFFGGRGLGISYLCEHFLNLEKQGAYKNAFEEVDPFSEDNAIIISTSPTSGTRMPTSGRIHMNYKSPLTNAYGSTNAGGRVSVDLKKTGVDVLIITGKAERPTYLIIRRGSVEFVDAEATAGLDALETRRHIIREYGDKIQVLAIGAGGKNRVLFSSVMSGTGKAFGRGGGGAVWGSKNLYAMGVIPDPTMKIDVAAPESFDPKNEKGAMYHVRLKLDLGKFTRREDMFGILASMGSLGFLGMVNNYRQLIHNNMKDTNHRIEDIRKINGEALRNHYRDAKPGEKKIKVKKSACFNCPIVCKRHTTLLDADDTVIEEGEGPEFESTTLLGANLSIYNLILITQASNLANRYGLDTISLGGTIAAFFEIYEAIRTKQDALTPLEERFMDDIKSFVKSHGEPGFGRAEVLIPLVHAIGNVEGIGAHLAQGSFRFAKRYGYEAFSMSVKGLELPAYDPRTSYSQALCYEMNNRGGGHLEGGYTAPHAYCAGYGEWPGHRVEGTPLISKNATLKNTTLDIIGACAYSSFSLDLDEYAALVNGVTGQKHDSGSLKRLAWRTITLERCFNRLCGLTDADDWLPGRFYEESIQTHDGDVVCDRDAFRQMHMEYYHSVGWDDRGVPARKTLETLELSDYIPGRFVPSEHGIE